MTTEGHETHIFRAKVSWKEGKKGILEFEGKPELEFATPPEFGGPKETFSPEELFVAAINSCTLTTFLYFAERLGVRLLKYSCTAEGAVEKTEGPYVFKEVTLRPTIEVEGKEMAKKAARAIELAHKYCIVTRSVDKQVKIRVGPTIRSSNRG